ncbi:hypothetical protein MD535_15975 [Vibrio sp. ZSDZ65]|uniref:Uncharacterized protein n=1 Tax=Vibrio qingdaonensis TaxID=2829491 RepID=A0A9X3CQY5_9VIBR|nr:hypothetical protein [Vibrio qingdaonensis]MCW8347499.1 hypothetical protein [Vibrio qingdaonensis]
MLKVIAVVSVLTGLVVGAKYNKEVNDVLDIERYEYVVDKVLESHLVFEELSEDLTQLFEP